MANVSKQIRNQLKNVTKEQIQVLLNEGLIAEVEKRLVERVEVTFSAVTENFRKELQKLTNDMNEQGFRTYIHIRAIDVVMSKLLNTDSKVMADMLIEAAKEVHAEAAAQLKGEEIPAPAVQEEATPATEPTNPGSEQS